MTWKKVKYNITVSTGILLGLPENNGNYAIEILYWNPTEKVSSRVVFDFIVFYFKNKTQRQYPTNDTKVINLETLRNSRDPWSV